MASVQELRRVIDIRSKTTGVKESTADLKKLDAAYTGVTIESAKLEKATLSVDRQFAALQRKIDPAFRATERLAAAERTLSAAQAQGLITLARKNELLALAAVQSDRATVATGRLAAAQRALSGVGGVAAGAVGLGGGAAVTGILAAGFAVSAFIKNSIEAQGALAQLNAVIASTGGAAGMTAGELTDLAMQMQRVTTYGDDAVVAAESLLLTFTRIGRDTFPQAVTAILDVSTAMGQDLKSSTVQIGKALNDPIKGITALTRIGVTFTEAQKLMIESLAKTGDLAGAQAIILRELQTEFGGSAKAARDTLGGALTALGNAFGDLFEVSSAGSRTLTKSINGLVDVMSDPATISGIQNFGAALFDSFGDTVNLFRDNPWLLGLVGGAMVGGRVGGMQGAIIGGAIGAGEMLKPDIKTIEEGAAAFQKLQDSASAAAAGMNAAGPAAATAAAGVDQMKAAFLQATAGSVVPMTETLEGRFTDAFGKAAGAATKAGAAIGQAVDIPLPQLRPEIDKIGDSLTFVKDAAIGAGISMVTAFLNGDASAQKMADTLYSLRDSLAEGALKDLIAGKWISAGVKGLAAVAAQIFGNRAQERAEALARREEARLKREEKLQARKEELARKEDKRQSLSEGRAGYADRAYFSGLDTSTLEGQLAQFDREALRERQAVKDSISNAKKRDEQLAALDKALAAERLKIQRDFNDQMVADAKAAADEMNRVARSIVDYVNGLNTGSDSPLSPQDRYTAASAAFSGQLALAQGGNVDAQSSITQYADAVLKASREMYASSEAFQTDFATVKAALLALPAVTQSTDPVVQALVAAQSAIVSAVDEMKATLNSAILAGPAATATALAPSFDTIDVNVSGGITLAEMTTALGTTNARLLSIFTTLDADGDGQITKLELIAARTLTTATNTTGASKDTSVTTVNTTLTGNGDAGLGGIKRWAKETAGFTQDVKARLNWMPVIAQRLYEVALFTSQAKGVKGKLKLGADRSLYTEDKNSLQNTFAARMGGMIPGYADGGSVGNGTYNVDSVRARYAGGGDIMLAGGEFVTRATSVNAMTMPILDAINRTGRGPAATSVVANDNGRYFADQNRVLMSGFRALVTATERIEERLAMIESANRETTRAVRDKPVAKPATKVA